jgi:hypothetical protein
VDRSVPYSGFDLKSMIEVEVDEKVRDLKKRMEISRVKG